MPAPIFLCLCGPVRTPFHRALLEEITWGKGLRVSAHVPFRLCTSESQLPLALEPKNVSSTGPHYANWETVLPDHEGGQGGH